VADQNDKQNNNRELFRAMGLVTSIGVDLAACTVGGTLLGKWLDDLWGTRPLMILIGLFLGLAGGIYGITKLLKAFGFGEDKKQS